MLLIYREYDDLAGEGVRAELNEHSTSAEAEAEYNRLTSDPSTLRCVFITGSVNKRFTRDGDERTLTDDELRKSSVDVPEELV